MTTEEEKPLCTLQIKSAYNASVKVFHIENVTSIYQTDSASLTEMSTIVYDSTNNFLIDTGNTRKYEISVTRSNPTYYNDSSSDDRDWSNGKWFAEFRSAIDFWQNFAYSPVVSGSRTGGFLFTFVPPDKYSDLYPALSENVYISGSISPRINGQRLTFSLPLQVSSMVETVPAVDMRTFTFGYNAGPSSTFTRDYPLNSTALLPSPDPSWAGAGGSIFKSWTNLSSGLEYNVNQGYFVTSDQSFYANWIYPEALLVISGNGDAAAYGHASIFFRDAANGRVTIFGGYAVNVQVIAVGAGGAGGNYVFHRSSDSGGYVDRKLCGGGGGAGEYKVSSFSVADSSEDKYFSFHVGKGVTGNNGEATWLKAGTATIVSASGGNKGQAMNADDPGTAAAGGLNYVAGGVSGYFNGNSPVNGVRGTAGVTGAPSGTGGTSVFDSLSNGGYPVKAAGGGGGASAKLDFGATVKYNGAEDTFGCTSAGGDGSGWAKGSSSMTMTYTPPTAGSYGGGAGGGSATGTTDDTVGIAGGDGIMIMLFYQG